jgi:hypothetical protein
MCPIPNGFRDRAISLYSTQYLLLINEFRTVQFGIGHMCVYIFLLRMVDIVTFPPGTLCILNMREQR